ncbi:hypothetical protein [Micromonospora sp. NPDC049891]|uniref:hypothetical protein n=1 Tax=Micromonospora sp. NPDC049891 TaxID=3155655 RepID=UPI0033DDA6EB
MSAPKRSAAARSSPSTDVFNGFRKSRGGFTGTAKGSGRTWNDNEHRPTSRTPATRKEVRRDRP